MQNEYLRMGWLTQVHSIIVKKLWQVSFHKLTNICGGHNNFDVTKGKSKNYYNLLIRENAKPPNIIQKLQSNFHFNSDNLKQIFKLPHSIVVESYVKAFQYKVINSILYTNTKLYKIGFRTNDLCTFCDNQPESLTHLFYHCSRSKQFWIQFELYWCLISNQLIPLCLENVLFGILTKNAELLYNYWKTLFVGP